jgi:hypothetical protein
MHLSSSGRQLGGCEGVGVPSRWHSIDSTSGCIMRPFAFWKCSSLPKQRLPVTRQRMDAVLLRVARVPFHARRVVLIGAWASTATCGKSFIYLLRKSQQGGTPAPRTGCSPFCRRTTATSFDLPPESPWRSNSIKSSTQGLSCPPLLIFRYSTCLLTRGGSPERG